MNITSKLPRITPMLWFDTQAEDAVDFYLSVFKNSKKGRVSHYANDGQETHHMPDGSVMVVEFELEGQSFQALNAGPIFRFNEAISFVIYCDTQDEIDYYWNKLKEGGDEKAQVCGWLKDRFGLSWQVVPSMLPEMQMTDSRKASNVMKEVMKMKKLDIATLKAAFEK